MHEFSEKLGEAMDQYDHIGLELTMAADTDRDIVESIKKIQKAQEATSALSLALTEALIALATS